MPISNALKRSTERYLPEKHNRDNYLIDKGRIIHSSFFRKMGSKTQIITKYMHNTAKDDFLRTRLTHSLEVAQIGREIAEKFALDGNAQEAVCLAHDIGHPPFGHYGERVLAELAPNIGGFEGNAQSFRVLTRLAYKKLMPNGRSVGLNLTREVLNGILKYPWTLENSPNGKFSVYEPDINIFNWVRKYSTDAPHQPSIYAQIMDFSDDVSYSVNDVEDTIITTKNNLSLLIKNKSQIIDVVAKHFSETSSAKIDTAIKRMHGMPFWINKFNGTHKDIADVKNFTSNMIGRFVSNIKIKDNLLVIPANISEEIAVLKAFSHIYLINSKRQDSSRSRQKQVIVKAYNKFHHNPASMSRNFYEEYLKAGSNKMLKQRIIIDQVASLTDESILKI